MILNDKYSECFWWSLCYPQKKNSIKDIFTKNISHCLYENTGSVPTKDMQTLPPQFLSHFHERCAIGWIELEKKTKKNSPIFIFRVIVKNSSQIGMLTLQKWPKNDHNSKNKNRKNVKYGFFLSIQPIPDFSCKFYQFWKKKKIDNFFYWKSIFFSNVVKFTRKMCWIDRKNHTSDFSYFYFSSYGRSSVTVLIIFISK